MHLWSSLTTASLETAASR